jgi:alkylation response protein AidB-like acyl-CoA dehydrogenase
MLQLNFNEKTEKFRNDFKSWLNSNPPPLLASHAALDEFVEVSSKWQATLAVARFIGVHFPEEYGGRGLGIVEEAIIQEELARKNAPQLVGLFGLTMVGPVLLRYGTAEQKLRYLPKILSAEELWCQGFSEPGAGSDLASLKTSAIATATGWEVTGQKIWTSFAQYAKWCFLLVRTDQAAAKHKGLSYLLTPMSAPGITVRPLTQITGDQEFNEVFFDSTPIASENIVGNAGEGWKIAISTLMFERVILTFARHLQSEAALNEIAQTLVTKNSPEHLRTQFGRLLAKNMAVRTLALSHLVNYTADNPPGPEGSCDKLLWSETFQEISKFGLDILGDSKIFTGEESYLQGAFQHRYLYSRGRTIAAGTSEIQRNIIAERILGLPKANIQ